MGANWNPNHAPGSFDIAIITNSGNYTVTLDVNASAGGLILGANDGSTQAFLINGQTFTLAGQATLNSGGLINLSSGTFNGNTSNGGVVINGTLTCSGGALTGKLTVSTNSVLNLVGPSAANTFTGPLFLTNYGTVTWISGNLSGIGCEIDNYGLWDAKTNATFTGGGGAIFNNYGTFRKSGGNNNIPPYFTLFDVGTAFNNFGTLDVQVGSVEISGGTGSGVFNNATNASIYFNSIVPYILTGNPTFTGGTIAGNLTGNNAVVQGTLTPSFITLSGTLTLASNTVLNLGLVPGQPIFFQGTILTNYGTVVWSVNDLKCQSSPQIYNYGLWDNQTNKTFYGAYNSSGTTTFNNYGTFRKSGGSFNGISPYNTTLDNTTTFNNYGTLDVQSGILDIYNGTSSGTFNNATNTSTWFGACVLTGNPTFTGGTIAGNFTGSNAVVQGTLTPSYITLSGTLTLASNTVLNLGLVPGQPIVFQGTILTNYGTVVLSVNDLNCQSSPQIYNFGLWDDQTNNTFYGAYSGGGTTTFNNYATFRKSGGTGGQTSLDSATTFNNSGTLDVQTGLLNLNGNYALAGGRLNFGINSSSDYGSISLAGTAALAGRLSVNLNNNYSPGAGSSFRLINYSSETGTFNAMSLPPLSGQIWQSNYGVRNFKLSLTNLPPMQLSSVTTLNGNSISFSWDTFDGQTYQVQYTTNLAPANWINLGNPIPGTNGTTTVSDTFGLSPQMFYRVVLPP